jgi:hypothetical protein
MRFSIYQLAAVLLALPAWAQTQSSPRTPDGHPDFTGAWISSFVTPLERIPGATSLTIGEADAKAAGEKIYQQLVARENGLDPDVLAADVRNLLRVGNDYRTSLVVEPADGKIPFTAEGLRLVDDARKQASALPDGPESRPEADRCVAGTGQAPLTLTPTINSRQIVQTGRELVLYSEDGPDVRIISLGGPHRPDAVIQWGGDSVAHWDGDDLIVETENQRGLVRTGPSYAFVVRPEARVIETLKFLSPDEILYSYSIVDPVIYAAPWRAEFTLTRSKAQAVEYSCHEGNYSLAGMLQSARSIDRKATEAAIGPPLGGPVKVKARRRTSP